VGPQSEYALGQAFEPDVRLESLTFVRADIFSGAVSSLVAQGEVIKSLLGFHATIGFAGKIET
jgi:hypothetical protein